MRLTRKTRGYVECWNMRTGVWERIGTLGALKTRRGLIRTIGELAMKPGITAEHIHEIVELSKELSA